MLHPKDWVVVGSAGGFLAYCFYLASRFRDPLAFASTQASPGWDQPAGPHTWFKVAMFEELAREPLGPAAIGLLFQASIVLLVLVAAPFVGGLLTTSTMTTKASFGGDSEPPGYTQASIATIRLWRAR